MAHSGLFSLPYSMSAFRGKAALFSPQSNMSANDPKRPTPADAWSEPPV